MTFCLSSYEVFSRFLFSQGLVQYVFAESCCPKQETMLQVSFRNTERMGGGCSSGWYSFLYVPGWYLCFHKTVIVFLVHDSLLLPMHFLKKCCLANGPLSTRLFPCVCRARYFLYPLFFWTFLQIVKDIQKISLAYCWHCWTKYITYLHPNHWRKHWTAQALGQQAA